MGSRPDRWLWNHSLLQKDRAPLVQGYYCRYWTLDSSRDLEFLVQCLDLFDNENLQPLQLILRRLLISNQMLQSQATGEVASDLRIKADMMKYAAIVISTAPIMMLYPFVQKYFNQGVMIGALKE